MPCKSVNCYSLLQTYLIDGDLVITDGFIDGLCAEVDSQLQINGILKLTDVGAASLCTEWTSYALHYWILCPIIPSSFAKVAGEYNLPIPLIKREISKRMGTVFSATLRNGQMLVQNRNAVMANHNCQNKYVTTMLCITSFNGRICNRTRRYLRIDMTHGHRMRRAKTYLDVQCEIIVWWMSNVKSLSGGCQMWNHCLVDAKCEIIDW